MFPYSGDDSAAPRPDALARRMAAQAADRDTITDRGCYYALAGSAGFALGVVFTLFMLGML